MNKICVGFLILCWSLLSPDLFAMDAPSGLMVDLIERTDQVWMDGYPANISLEEIPSAVERIQYPAILSEKPSFSWIVNDQKNSVLQSAYQIQTASKKNLLSDSNTIKPDLWDSGKVQSGESSSRIYEGKKLSPNSVCFWRVRTWNNFGECSPWSSIKSFKMGSKLLPYAVSRYPSVKTEDRPVHQKKLSPKVSFYDFGKAAFGRMKIRISLNGEKGKAIVRLGERIKEEDIDSKPAGSTRYAEYTLSLLPGTQTYFIKTRVDKRNTSGAAFLVPDYLGEMMPFRYATVEVDDPKTTVAESAERESAWYPYDPLSSFFHCDQEILNQVWDLCRYSIQATSFLGVYIDGDRERIPYEGDALLNQLSHYSIDREYTLARYTQEYLLFHPTWPTEWILQSVQMAWYDYLYTGDSRNIARFYSELKAKSLVALAEENGLISTQKGKLTKKIIDSVHFKNGKIKDIVDWPHKGLAGNENAASGETDGFVFNDFNVVVNAYHYFSLKSMEKFAEILGYKEDAAFYRRQIEKFLPSFEKVFFDQKRGIYKDGENTDHASLHGNMFPLAFGLVPEAHKKSVCDFILSRGMNCSVYGAQFLLDAVYEGGNGQYGLNRMIATDLRSWFNMLRVGSTISMEAWDDRYKPNQDWNHAWGAAPANIIPRKLVGVEPLEPAFKKVRIKPQPGDLKEFLSKIPTIRGQILVSYLKKEDSVQLELRIPANVRSECFIPLPGKNSTITVNGKPIRQIFPNADQKENFCLISDLGSGHWIFQAQLK
ncbi:MAG: alpha-L-rhamnosidase C-terminal domain-containing protein [Planctomycetia bacterium]|nr:alpha-L-rhamnosidase C-terminal domain-containing protein [Planctomycetia bacterium]